MRSAACLVTLLAVSLVCAQDEPPKDLSGIYEVHGQDANGEPYSGIAFFKKRGDGYICQFTTGVGANAVGVASISDDGMTLSASWLREPVVGQTIYALSKKGKIMTGKWTALGGDVKFRSEILTYLAPWPAKKKIIEAKAN